MSKKFHINKRGEIKPCKATKKPCPMSGGHFQSTEQAESVIKDQSLEFEKYNQYVKENRKYTTEEASERSNVVRRMVDQALLDGKSTEVLYKNKDGSWVKEREEIHNFLLNSLMDKYKNVPSSGQVIMSAGLPGAGKTTVLTQFENIATGEYATISADDFKEMLADIGAIPKIEGLTPMETSTLAHEESSYLADRLLQMLSKENKNIIYDFTCKNPIKTKARLRDLESKGYDMGNVQFVYVDISPEVAKLRANIRYTAGLNEGIEEDHYSLKAQKETKASGGRYLPNSVIDDCTPKGLSRYHSINAESVEILHKDKELNLKTPIVYDNSGASPQKKSAETFFTL